MANTVIQLKKSATPSAAPVDLANGEIAINYADGKLFYKDSSGSIQQISGGGNSFSTINAAGTLVVADLQNDIVTLDQGSNIIITGDSINDRITIAADLTSANGWANTKLSNGTVTLAGALTTTGQIYANSQITIYPTASGGEGGQIDLWGSDSYPDWSIDSYQDSLRFFTLNTGTQIVSFFNAGGGSVKLGINTGNPSYAVDVSGDVNVTGKFRINGAELATGTADLTPANNWANTVAVYANNYAGVMANAANAYAASLTPDLSPAFNKANDAYTVANAAFDKANSANVLAFNTGAGANAWSNTVGLSANNYAGEMANSANGYAVSVGASGNAYTNSVATAANNWANTKLSNTSGVMFEGNLNIKTDLWIGNNITNVTSLIFNTSTNRTPTTPGELTWSQDDSTLRFDMDTTTNVIGHIGQDVFYYVKNQSGSSIAKGTVVRFAGTLGASSRLLIAPAIANNSYPSKYVMGVTATSIANGDDGFVISQGKLRQIDTSMFSAGDILYLSPSTAGGFSNTMPSAPNNKITVAAVVNKDNVQGVIEVRVALGSKLNEDELAELDSLTDSDILQYVSANGRFENKNTLVSAYGVANAGFDKANSANVLAYNTGIGANAWSNTVGASSNAYVNVSTTAANNYAGYMANAVNAYANTLGGGGVTVSNSAPSTPSAGDLWWNKQYGRLFVYYSDVDSSQWVDASPSADVGYFNNITSAAFNKANGAYTICTQVFCSTGSWTMPTGTQFVMVDIVGGGGGGEGGGVSAPFAPAQGGAGGSGGRFYFPASLITSPVCVVVGAGGSGGPGICYMCPGSAGVGGSSCFGCYIKASGGCNGGAADFTKSDGSTFDDHTNAYGGGRGGRNTYSSSSPGCQSVHGGGGGGGAAYIDLSVPYNQVIGVAGLPSLFAGKGGDGACMCCVTTPNGKGCPGFAGCFPGGGGGAGSTGACAQLCCCGGCGGPGASGRVIVYSW